MGESMRYTYIKRQICLYIKTMWLCAAARHAARPFAFASVFVALEEQQQYKPCILMPRDAYRKRTACHCHHNLPAWPVCIFSSSPKKKSVELDYLIRRLVAKIPRLGASSVFLVGYKARARFLYGVYRREGKRRRRPSSRLCMKRTFFFFRYLQLPHYGMEDGPGHSAFAMLFVINSQ